MHLACTNSWPMTPTTRAFFVRRFRDRNARLFCLVDCQIAQNEKFFQFLLIDFFRDIGIRMQNHRRLQSIPNQFLLTCALDRLPDYAAQSQKLRNLSARHASSAVKARIGASNRQSASKILCIAACVARRRDESGPSQYIRSLVMST